MSKLLSDSICRRPEFDRRDSSEPVGLIVPNTGKVFRKQLSGQFFQVGFVLFRPVEPLPKGERSVPAGFPVGTAARFLNVKQTGNIVVTYHVIRQPVPENTRLCQFPPGFRCRSKVEISRGDTVAQRGMIRKPFRPCRTVRQRFRSSGIDEPAQRMIEQRQQAALHGRLIHVGVEKNGSVLPHQALQQFVSFSRRAE